MLTVSLHGIRITAPGGMYAGEKILENRFEVDVDLWLDARGSEPWPFIDYTEVAAVVRSAFGSRHEKLEEYVQDIWGRLRESFFIATKARVLLRKYHPPMGAEVGYAQVVFEQ